MLRSILGVIAGLVVGIVLIGVVQFLGMLVIPLPDGIDPMDHESRKKAMYEGKIPVGSMVFVLIAYVVGSFVGGWLAAMIAGRSHLMHALVVGGMLMIAGIVNLVMISHPAWFAIASFGAYIPPAVLGGLLARPRAGG